MAYNYTKKSIWKWVLIYLVIAAAAYGFVYYFFFYKGNSLYDTQNYQNQNEVQNNQPQVASDEMSDWKTYRNEEYGFEFKYPPNWILDDQKFDGDAIGVISPENDFLARKTFEGSYYYTNFSVHACDRLNQNCLMGGTYVNMKNKTILDFLNDPSPYKSYEKSSFMPEVNIDGIKGYGIIAGGFGANYEIILERDNRIYIIDFPSSEKELTAEQKEILSTFKFIK